jgi:hypothetical protein
MITNIWSWDTVKTTECLEFRTNIDNNLEYWTCVKEITYTSDFNFLNTAQNDLFLFSMGTFIINFTIIFIIIFMRYLKQMFIKIWNLLNQ